MFRKVSHLVTDSTSRHRTGGGAQAASVVGRVAGVAMGAALVVAALAGSATVTLSAQQKGDDAPPGAAAPSTHAPAAVDRAYHYDSSGRRDPFTSLDRASDPKGSARDRVSGLAGLSIGEVTVKGVVKSQGRLVAMLQAPDNKTYIVRPNDRLLDGIVRAVTPEAVVFVQQVNDPLSLVKQREIRKPLRPLEEGK